MSTLFPPASFSELVTEAEAWETDPWAAEAILKVELLTNTVVDPCSGRGVLMQAAEAAGYTVFATDKYDWGCPGVLIDDFLEPSSHDRYVAGNTVFMNPPFSLSEQFVQRSFELKARKIVCFQKFAWWESQGRRTFWDRYTPCRIYICGDRATCWRFDTPVNEKGQHISPKTGKPMGNTPTAHAWFIWERGQPTGPLVSRIYKEDREE